MMTQGRCIRCAYRFEWSGKPLLRDAYCPDCDGLVPLSATSRLYRGGFGQRKPKTGPRHSRQRTVLKSRVSI